MASRKFWPSPESLPSRQKDAVLVVVETPAGSPSKYKFDEELGTYLLTQVLPTGMAFPFDFGFIPGTKGEDGDPLDVLLLIEHPVPMGCAVKARLIGVIEAEQTEKGGETERNDRLLAVADRSMLYADVKGIADLPKALCDQIEAFFITYNRLDGKKFKPLGKHGPGRAEQLVKEAMPKKKRKGKK